jgi:hypothetical protein
MRRELAQRRERADRQPAGGVASNPAQPWDAPKADDDRGPKLPSLQLRVQVAAPRRERSLRSVLAEQRRGLLQSVGSDIPERGQAHHEPLAS